MTQPPTPDQVAARDQVEAHNSRLLDSIVAGLRAMLDHDHPRWQVDEYLHDNLHIIDGPQRCTLLLTAVMRLVDQAPAQHQPQPRDHRVGHGDLTDTGLESTQDGAS